MRKYEQLAKDIIKNIGGKENVKELKHCVTRLRFTLRDESKAKDETIKNLKGVSGVVKAIGQYMVVIGEHLADVYDEVMLQLGFSMDTVISTDDKEKGILDRFISLISSSMGPTLNLLCACGIVKGLLTLATIFGLSTTSGIYILLNAVGDCVFYSLPLMLGYNAAKNAGIDPFFGFVLGAALTYPSIQSVDIDLFGYIINAKYTSSFLPIIFSLFIAVPIYKFFNKHIHPLFKGFLTPLLTLLIVFPLAFAIIGPFANTVANWLNVIINSVFVFSPILGGILLGGFQQILVIFGVHGMITMFAFYDLLAGNPSLLCGVTGVICFAVAGTTLAVTLKSKNAELKSQAGSSLVSAILGITEPGMYSVIIPRKKLLLTTCLGGAAGGFIVTLLNMKWYTYTGLGLTALLAYLNPEGTTSLLNIVLIVVVPLLTSFILGTIIFKDEDDKKVENKKTELRIKLPVDGQVKPLSECSDSVFAAETIGKGCLIVPDNGNVYAPINGTVVALFPTKHAIGIRGDDGVEVMIHIGINTVNLNGKGFDVKVKQNDVVKEGQLIMTFDMEEIEKAGFLNEITFMVTNSKDYIDVVEVDFEHHKHGDDVLVAVK